MQKPLIQRFVSHTFIWEAMFYIFLIFKFFTLTLLNTQKNLRSQPILITHFRVKNGYKTPSNDTPFSVERFFFYFSVVGTKFNWKGEDTIV